MSGPPLRCALLRKRVGFLLGLTHVHHQKAIATAPARASRKSSTMPSNSTMAEPSRAPTERQSFVAVLTIIAKRLAKSDAT
jgi:hypothetical protein